MHMPYNEISSSQGNSSSPGQELPNSTVVQDVMKAIFRLNQTDQLILAIGGLPPNRRTGDMFEAMHILVKCAKLDMITATKVFESFFPEPKNLLNLYSEDITQIAIVVKTLAKFNLIDEAVELTSKAIKINIIPGNLISSRLITPLGEMGYLKQADQLFIKLINSRPGENNRSYYTNFLIRYCINDSDSAHNLSLNEAAKVNPDNFEVQKALFIKLKNETAESDKEALKEHTATMLNFYDKYPETIRSIIFSAARDQIKDGNNKIACELLRILAEKDPISCLKPIDNILTYCLERRKSFETSELLEVYNFCKNHRDENQSDLTTVPLSSSLNQRLSRLPISPASLENDAQIIKEFQGWQDLGDSVNRRIIQCYIEQMPLSKDSILPVKLALVAYSKRLAHRAFVIDTAQKHTLSFAAHSENLVDTIVELGIKLDPLFHNSLSVIVRMHSPESALKLLDHCRQSFDPWQYNSEKLEIIVKNFSSEQMTGYLKGFLRDNPSSANSALELALASIKKLHTENLTNSIWQSLAEANPTLCIGIAREMINHPTLKNQVPALMKPLLPDASAESNTSMLTIVNIRALEIMGVLAGYHKPKIMLILKELEKIKDAGIPFTAERQRIEGYIRNPHLYSLPGHIKELVSIHRVPEILKTFL